MITNRLSPSSAISLDGCEAQWFFGYGLYFREPNRDANLKGTAAHSVMEAVAKSKLLRQQGKKWCKDEVFGRIKDKYDYDDLIDQSFNYYRDRNPHLEWDAKDLKDLSKRCYKAKDGEHGYAFPENYHEIVQTEQRFKIPVEEDWARYSIMDGDKIVKKQFAVTGVIDLVYRDKDGNLHYLDYKFGKSKPQDWNTGKEKTEGEMGLDVQLAMYYWAISQLYKGENPETHIWYVLTDNYWTSQFTKEEQEFALAEIKNRFNRIRIMKDPSFKYTYKCKWCPYSKTKISDYTGNDSHDLFGDGSEKFDLINGQRCACDGLKYFFEHRTLETITENLKNG